MRTLLLTLLVSSLFFTAEAQNTIHGTVTDSFDGKGLMDANIMNVTTRQGAVTDKEGDFQIMASEGDVLEISYVGFKPLSYEVEDELSLVASLEIDELEEVILEGYGLRGCRLRSICTVTYFHLEVEQLRELALFPNPSSGIFNLGFVKEHRTVNVSIHNIIGQQVQNVEFNNFGKEVSIDLSAQPTGIYLVNVIADGEKLKTHKLIKN
ncbi:MAG: T9SS type A sorting domain-containing protein [Flavobacteriaceae bacterium]|nr:T9SS type A sorting domain-containing protein [Flavobacteriaceae bacterium]